MAWTNLSFAVGSKLTATNMTQLQANFQALANGDTGSPNGPRMAAGWVNFNGTGTVAIRASFNVASVTDNGVGSYDVNWDVNLSTNNAPVAACGNNDASIHFARIRDTSTAYTRVHTVSIAGALADVFYVCVAAFDN